MNKKIGLLVLGLFMGVLIVTACSSTSSGDSSFPTGKFLLSNSEDEGIYFNQDGTWSGFSFGQTVAEGKYHVKGDIYTEEAGPQGCNTDGSYKYSFDGTNLKFELVGVDTCQNRRESLDGITYVLSK